MHSYRHTYVDENGGPTYHLGFIQTGVGDYVQVEEGGQKDLLDVNFFFFF